MNVSKLNYQWNSRRSNLIALNSLTMGIEGGIADDSVDIAYGGNIMGIIGYRCCKPNRT